MANIVIKKDFVDGDKLFAQQLNNNFGTIEKGINDGNKIVWQDGTEVKFKRLITEDIENLPIQEGAIIYDIKKGAHYADYKGVRTVIGGDAKQIKISPTEPTTGEEVWIEKGKNLFNKNSVVAGYINEDGSIYVETSYRTSDFIPVTPNTTYYKTKTDSVRSKFYDKNKNPLTNNYNDLEGSGNFAFTTPENAYYLRVSLTIENLDTLQIEQGSIGTTYEPFTRKVYTKNDNGVYEEFYDEEEHNKVNYSTSEQKIGTWIDGKPLYRKVLNCGLLLNGEVKEVPTGLTNVNYLKWDAIAIHIQSDATDWPYQITQNTTISDKKAKINCQGNLSTYNGYVTILYTKN